MANKKVKKPIVYNTTLPIKIKNWPKFVKLMASLLLHGGSKYELNGFADMEATDMISKIYGGESEFDWILGTMAKYMLRFKNFHREKDLLKIATYCFILWLKQGNHLKSVNDTDTKK